MAQLSLYKYVNPGGVRDKNLEQVTIDAKKFLIRKGGGKQQSPQPTDRTNGYNAYGRKTILGINRLGASLNSSIVGINNINSTLNSLNKKAQESETKKKKFDAFQFNTQKKLLKLELDKDKSERNRKRREKDESSEKSSEKGLGSKMLSPVAKTVKKVGGGLLDFLSNLLGLFFRTALLTGVLKFIADPQNVEKVGKFFIVVRDIVKFFAKVIEFGVFQAVEGLVKIIDGGIFTKIVGIFQFLGGILVLFAAQRWLNPFKIGRTIKDLRVVFKVLSFLPKALGMAARAAVAISKAAAGKWGWKKVLIGTGIAVGAGMAVNKMTEGGGDGEQSQETPQTAPESSPTPPGPAGQQTSPANTLVQGTEQTKPKPEFAVGGISKGPDSGYPVTLHGTEAIIPLDNKYTRSGGNPLANVLPGLNLNFGKQKEKTSGPDILSGTGSMNKTAKSISSGMKLTHTAVGTSLLANLGNVISSMGPLGNLVRPFVQQVAAPIAQSFGVPANILNVVTAKEKLDIGSKKEGRKKGDGDLRTTIGEGTKNIKRVDVGTKWVPSGDKSVRGMLADVVSGLLYMTDKVGSKGGPKHTENATTPQQENQQKDTSINQNSASATAAAIQGAGSINQRQAGATANMKSGQASVNSEKFSSKAEDRKGGEVAFKYDGKEYKVVINATNGHYEIWDRYSPPPPIGYPYNIRGTSNQELKQAGFDQVRAYFVNNAPAKGIALKYITEDDVKNKEKITKNADKSKLDKKAAGGWISGPMSGYPVSLDGGRSVAFEGHGTEWVGFKKAAGGSTSSAFVIPYNTPKTQSHPGLTEKRFNEAKSGGYVLPFAAGGKAEMMRMKKHLDMASGDGRPRKKKKFADGGKAILEGAKKVVGFGKGAANMCALSTRKALAAAGHPAAGKVTSRGDLDSPKGSSWSKSSEAAASFAGSDMGSIIKSVGALQAGDIVLWKGGNGYGPNEITHVGIKGEGNDLWHHGRAAGFRKASMYTSYGGQNFAAGIRLSGKPGDVITSPTEENKAEGDQQKSEGSGNWYDSLVKAFSGETARELLGTSADTSTSTTTPTSSPSPSDIKPTTPPNSGSNVLKKSSELKDKKSEQSSTPQVSTLNTGGTTNAGGAGGGGGVVNIPTSATPKGNNTDFLIPMGSPLHNYVSPESLNKIK